MSAPTELSIPPHLWLKLLPDGPLYLALSGAPSAANLDALLLRPELALLWQPGRVTVALLDLARLDAPSPAHDASLASLARKLADAGCRRIAAATARAEIGAMLRGLPQRAGLPLAAATFEQSAAASQWLFSGAPAPAAAPAEPAAPLPPPCPPSSLALTEAPSHAQPTFGAPPPPPPAPRDSASFAATLPDPPRQGVVTPVPQPPQAPAILSFIRPSAATTKPSAQPLETAAPRLDRLLPLLLPRAAERATLGRPLAAGAADGPWLTVASGEPPRRFALLHEPGASDELLDELLAEAVVSLERMDIPYEIRTMPWGRFARALSAHAAEGILSPRFLARLQGDLGGRALAVAVPMRGGLLAARAGDGAAVAGLRAMARKIFDEAGALALTPALYLLEGGMMQGLLADPGGPTSEPRAPAQPALAAPAERPLAARTAAEAHLYLDLRGVKPEGRSERVEKTDDGPVLCVEGKLRGSDRPARFTFTVESPSAPPRSYGLSGPSRLIAPDEFMMMADALSKQVPASPEGLGPGERAEARVMLENAAAFLIEITRFIEPGAERVPEAAMKLRDRWEALQITAGRFDRARLEVVARVYRDIAAKF